MRKYTRRLEQFYVPVGFIKIFAQAVNKFQLENVLSGIEGDDLVFFISYEPSKQKIIDAIHFRIEKYNSDQKNDKWKLNGIKSKRNVR